MSHEFADLRSTSARILEAPAAAETDWQAYKTAKTALVGHLDRVISETTSRLDRHDVAVADDVDRLSRLGALGLGATVVVALLLALTLGAAFRARMVSLRRGVEQITRCLLYTSVAFRRHRARATSPATPHRAPGVP